MNEEAEKLESGKAALIGGLGALAGAVPLSLGASSPLLVSLSSIAISLITGVLFAVTYRLVFICSGTLHSGGFFGAHAFILSPRYWLGPSQDRCPLVAVLLLICWSQAASWSSTDCILVANAYLPTRCVLHIAVRVSSHNGSSE